MVRMDAEMALVLALILLFSPDAISAANPRVIDDSRARKLSNDLKRCTYYETCATYGLNVERVFQDGEWSQFSVWVRHKGMAEYTTFGLVSIEGKLIIVLVFG